MTGVSVVSRKDKEYRLRRARMGGLPVWVDIAPVREALLRWTGAGFSASVVGKATGVTGTYVGLVTSGRIRWIDRDWVDRFVSLTARRIYGIAEGRDFVSTVGAVRRIQAAQVIGYPASALAATTTVSRVLIGQRRYVWASTHHEIAQRYRELVEQTPGPDVRARNRGRRLGWHGPLAWDEDTIDDPYAEPETDEMHLDRRTEIIRTAQEGVIAGLPGEHVAADLSVKPSSLYETLRRYGRGDLASKLRRVA